LCLATANSAIFHIYLDILRSLKEYSMKLSARPLINIADVNTFDVSTQMELHVGNATTLYLQLVDLDKDTHLDPPGKRYMPHRDATLVLRFINIHEHKEFCRFASQPFAQDPSIWAVHLLSTDPIAGTVDVHGVLREHAVTKTFNLHAGLCIGVY
jgi:hypothetical protein